MLQREAEGSYIWQQQINFWEEEKEQLCGSIWGV